MKLIIGLGNPEQRYEKTRHNIGWRLLDMLADAHGVDFQPKDKFKALVAELSIDGDKILLVKPTTYYNLSGESCRSVADFYKIADEDTLVVHDELALDFGIIRARVGGSDAGNNGIKSINQHGGGQTNRLRVGIGSPQRELVGDTDFVISVFSKDEEKVLQETILPKALELVDDFISGAHQITSHTLHRES